MRMCLIPPFMDYPVDDIRLSRLSGITTSNTTTTTTDSTITITSNAITGTNPDGCG